VVHKLAPKLYLYFSSDLKSNGYNGKLAYFNMYIGPNSFRRGLV